MKNSKKKTKKNWRKVSANYTVEAAWIMAIVLWSMVSLIQYAYKLCGQGVGMMCVQQQVERIRHAEEKNEENLLWEAESSFYRLQVTKDGNTVLGEAKGSGWNQEIQSSVFDPEGFLRMISVVLDFTSQKEEAPESLEKNQGE